MQKIKQILFLAALTSLAVACGKDKKAADAKLTACEQAYESVSASAAAPPRDKFLKTCNKLPLMNKKCLQIAYSRGNRELCDEAKRTLDPAEHQLVELVNANPPAQPAQ